MVAASRLRGPQGTPGCVRLEESKLAELVALPGGLSGSAKTRSASSAIGTRAQAVACPTCSITSERVNAVRMITFIWGAGALIALNPVKIRHWDTHKAARRPRRGSLGRRSRPVHRIQDLAHLAGQAVR